MCLFTSNKKAKRFDKEVTVYKVIDINGYPPAYASYKYSEGLNEPQRFFPPKPTSYGGGTYEIGEGYLHAYTKPKYAQDMIDIIRWNTSNASLAARKFVIVKMKVPRMTPCYISDNGQEICSTALFWHKSLWFRIIRLVSKIFLY